MKWIIILSLSLLLLTASSDAESTELKKASFIPHWVPQAQFAGFYAAHERGLYRKHGIELTILPGGPAHSPLDYLLKRKADFGTLWLSSGLEAHAQGAKIVNIGQIIQRSALMLVAKKQRGILAPQDMQGKKVGLWGSFFRVQPEAFFRKYDLQVKVIPQSYSVSLFLRDGVDVASAMWYNEYHTILNAGVNPEELTPFFFQDHGLNFPEDGIYALSETVERDPELCRAFVTASMEGWKHAFDHPDETLDMVMKNLKAAYVPATRIHQRWMLERLKDLMGLDRGSIPTGVLRLEDFNRVVQALYESELIEKIPKYRDFHIAIRP